MTPNLLFWPGNDVVTFVVQKGEDFTVTVVPPSRFMDGLMAANALLAQGDFCPDEAGLQDLLPHGQMSLGYFAHAPSGGGGGPLPPSGGALRAIRR